MRRITTSSAVAALNFFVAMIAMLIAISLSRSAGAAVALLIIVISAVAALAVNVIVYRKLDGRVGIVKYICFSTLPWLLWIFTAAVLIFAAA